MQSGKEVHGRERLEWVRRRFFIAEDREDLTLDMAAVRTVAHATFGDIVLMKAFADGTGEYVAMKDFRGDTDLALHSFDVYRAPRRANVPTFDFYLLDVSDTVGGVQDKVIMPFIGQTKDERLPAVDGDGLCVGPTQLSGAMDRARADGLRYSKAWVNETVGAARMMIDRATQANIRLSQDAFFFTLRQYEGHWRPDALFVGDFDQVKVLSDEESTFTERLKTQNQQAIIGAIFALLTNIENVSPPVGKAFFRALERAITRVEEVGHGELPVTTKPAAER